MFRWIALIALVGTLVVSGTLRRRAEKAGGGIDRRREGRAWMLARLAVALPLFGSVIVYVAHPDSMAWSTLPLPAWLRWIGAVMALMAIPSAWWTLESLGSNVSPTVLTRDEQELVTHGPYRRVRHPLYSTGLALFVGIGLMAASWAILGMTALALVLVLVLVIPAEERELVDRFGEQYRAHRRRTGRLLPRLRGPDGSTDAGPQA